MEDGVRRPLLGMRHAVLHSFTGSCGCSLSVFCIHIYMGDYPIGWSVCYPYQTNLLSCIDPVGMEALVGLGKIRTRSLESERM